MKNGLSLKIISQWLESPIDSSDKAYGACIDTRLLKKGDLFFACKGNRMDGHDFLFQAAQKGAVGAVVSKGYSADGLNFPLIKVDDPSESLQILAKKYLENFPVKIVAVTGSMGKTTTKGFIAQLLASQFCVASTPGNYNSQLGLPLTVLNELSGSEDALVLEMGMTKKGQIARLVQIAPPDIALITGVALAHSENFDSLEEIANAKMEILSHSKTQLGIIDHQIYKYGNLKNFQNPIVSFSLLENESDYSLKATDLGLSLLQHGREVISFAPLSFPGKHNIHNFLAALIAANHFGVSWEALKEAAKSLHLPVLRLENVEWNGVLFINDAYNALPIAVKAALDSLPSPKSKGRKIAVLSDMRELGKFSQNCHYEIGEYALNKVDEIICFGEECKPLYDLWMAEKKPIFWASNHEEIINKLQATIRYGDVVLIKGSQASGFSKLLDKIIKQNEPIDQNVSAKQN